MVALIVVSVLVIEEQLLGNNVSGECDGGYSEAREGALEAVPPCKGTGIPPDFTIGA